jgi:hypothetical protein
MEETKQSIRSPRGLAPAFKEVTVWSPVEKEGDPNPIFPTATSLSVEAGNT